MQISDERAKRLANLLCDAVIQLEELQKRYSLDTYTPQLIADLDAEFTLRKSDGIPILKEETDG